MPTKRQKSQDGRRLLSVSGWGTALLIAGAFALPSAFVIEGPGPAVNVLGSYENSKIIRISGTTTYPSETELDLTTVSVAGGPGREVRGSDVVSAWINPVQDVQPKEFVYPAGTTTGESDAKNAVEMTDSQQVAAAAALKHLGKDVSLKTVVAGFVDEGKASQFKVGDVIETVAGTKITAIEETSAAVKASSGSTIEVGVRRGEQDLTLKAPVTTVSGQRSLGLYIQSAYRFPFELAFGLKGIGGPSAGTMLALGIVDELTEGSLGGHRHIAGTGTITEDGKVGAIGGIAQKVEGARKAGATVFLAPQANCAELSGRVPAGLDVYSVGTLDEAVSVLEHLDGGDASATRCG